MASIWIVDRFQDLTRVQHQNSEGQVFHCGTKGNSVSLASVIDWVLQEAKPEDAVLLNGTPVLIPFARA